MQIATLKIENLPEGWFAQIEAIIQQAFGLGASISADGTIVVSIPDDWSVATFITMLKFLLGGYDLKYTKTRGPGI